MNLNKKLNVMFILVLVCLVLVLAASYAWLTISTSPEVNRIDTNIGANGSLEIALLTEQTYADPVQIRTGIGDSAVEQDAVASNKIWGNVIDLNDERYGLSQITLLPSRLNVSADGDQITVSKNLLKTANFGIDGRMTDLSEDTVSAIYDQNGFTYYTDHQRYGVRAIGTMSNLTSQQTALALARINVKSYTAAASRTVKYAWRDHAPGILDILFRRYSVGSDSFTADDVAAVRDLTDALLEALDYVDAALRQSVIGVAAAQIADEPDFEDFCAMVSDRSTSLSTIVNTLGGNAPVELTNWAKQVDEMKSQGQIVVANSYTLMNGGSWEQLEPLLDVLLDADRAYLGDLVLASKEAFDSLSGDNVIILSPDCGIMAQIAAYAGNYSAFAKWTDNINVEARTADPSQTAYLIQIEEVLEGCKAAFGGWTRANMDDIYGFAVDLAFRCNEKTDLLLQTVAAMRVEENVEVPVTQGGGSYMRFQSDNMDTEQLLRLMDTIRVGFLSDRNTLLGVAKLNVSNYEEQEEGVFAPLHMYDYILEEDGSLLMGARRDDDASILSLHKNTPTVVTVVVWLDGDYVDNSMVGDSVHQSMYGVLNLQFSGSADLLPADLGIKDRE